MGNGLGVALIGLVFYNVLGITVLLGLVVQALPRNPAGAE
ncbi:hypothetical protein GCM10009612_49230 [Streptomyces beijiangensis]